MRTLAALLVSLSLTAAARPAQAQSSWTNEPASSAAAPVQPPAGQPAPAVPPPAAAPAYPPPPQAAPPAPSAPLPATPGYLAPQKTRDRWYIGFELGGGGGSLARGSQSTSFDDSVGGRATQVALEFKVGATLSPRLLFGLDIAGLRAQTDVGGVTTGATVVNYDAMLTFFPTERGFFLRAGVGLSRFSYDAVVTGYGMSREARPASTWRAASATPSGSGSTST